MFDKHGDIGRRDLRLLFATKNEVGGVGEPDDGAALSGHGRVGAAAVQVLVELCNELGGVRTVGECVDAPR